MWPLLLDSTEEECMKTLRRLELEAYGSLVSALRAQGGLTAEKLKILKDTASILHITPERHRAEIRRAVNDEQLCTIAQFAEGPDTYAEWSVEGRRKVRLVPRVVPQTAFLAVARRVADAAQADNAKMPWPAATARPPITKPSQPPTQVKYEHETDRNVAPPPAKKRRRLSQDSLPPPAYVSSVAKHRVQKHGISKIQQMYKSQSSKLAASTRQSPITSESTIMPPPRTTIKTIPPLKQRVEVSKCTTILPLGASLSQPTPANSITDTTMEIVSKAQQHPVTVAKVIQSGSPLNKSVIKLSQTQPHQKLVIVSASQSISSNKIVTSINTPLKLKAANDDSINTAEINTTKSSAKVLSSQVIVSKSQLTPFSCSSQTTLNAVATTDNLKPKVLTVQAKVRPQGSIIVPLQGQNSTTGGQFAGVSVPVLQGVQWKAIQGKSTVKLLPLSGNAKIIQKPGVTVGSAPIYVMSKPTNIVVNKNSISTASNEANNTTELTTKTSTLSNITHIRPLTQKTSDDLGKVLVVRKAPTSASSVVVTTTSSATQSFEVKEDEKHIDIDRKSTVLQDALRASGVTAVDDDIESQISQYTAIPTVKNKSIWQSSSSTSDESSPITVTKSIQNIQLQDTKYLTLEEAVAILGDNSETRALLSHLQIESTPGDGQLDPQTGIYSPINVACTGGETGPTAGSNKAILSSNQQIPPQQVVESTEERLDIFSTALATADIQLEGTEYFETDSTSSIIEENAETLNTSTPLTDKQLTDILTGGGDTNR